MTIMDNKMEINGTRTDKVVTYITDDNTYFWIRTSSSGQRISAGPVYFSREICLIAAKRFNGDLPPENFFDQTKDE